jgi:hypothetical protein
VVPPTLTSRIQQETYSPQWREIVPPFLERVEDDAFDDPVAVKLAAFLKAKRDEILDLVGGVTRSVGWKTHRAAKWVAKFQSAFKEPLENQCNRLAILSAAPASTSDREEQYAVGDLVRILRRFRGCCQYLQEPPKAEREVQDIVVSPACG